MRFKFTKREIEQALDRLTIIVDSREQKSTKYKNEWDRNQIKFYSKEEYDKFNKTMAKKDLHEACLPAGDYSAFIPANTFKGLERALWFDKVTVIEKKANINELAGNISKTDILRVRNEFARLKANGTRHRIMISDPNFFKHLYEGDVTQRHNWKNQNSLAAAILREISAWETEIIPVPEQYMARFIYDKLKYDVKHFLEEGFNINMLDRIED